MAAPAKIAQGNISGAFIDPFTQLAKSPSTAPTTSEVAEMYGVPREKRVAPIVQGNPLYGTTYEWNPLPEDENTVTIHPSQQAGALVDSVAGGEGLNLATKGVNLAARGISKGIRSAAQSIKPNVLQKQNSKEIIEAANRLGIKVTPAMLDDAGFVERLEYTLSQSPNFLGQRVKRAHRGIDNVLQDRMFKGSPGSAGM